MMSREDFQREEKALQQHIRALESSTAEQGRKIKEALTLIENLRKETEVERQEKERYRQEKERYRQEKENMLKDTEEALGLIVKLEQKQRILMERVAIAENATMQTSSAQDMCSHTPVSCRTQATLGRPKAEPSSPRKP
jgi:hypothetical protein